MRKKFFTTVVAAILMISCDSSTTSPNATTNSNANVSTFVDSRDGQSYKWVKIGTQTWMAQNLNYEVNGSYCYNGESSKCNTYGRLYIWTSAMQISSIYSDSTYAKNEQIQGICPTGWHLPSFHEWAILAIYMGINPIDTGSSSDDSYIGTIQGAKLKGTSNLWDSGSVFDSYGFNALPSGYNWFAQQNTTSSMKGMKLGNTTIFWSSSDYKISNFGGPYYARAILLNADTAAIGDEYNDKKWAISVRCIKN